MAFYAEVFDHPESYTAMPPPDDYVDTLLARDDLLLLVALQNARVIGGLSAYVLPKPEQDRCEIFVYDLGVAESHRRQGIATALLRRIQEIAVERGASTVFIQAEPVDAPAVALYRKLAVHTIEAFHFELPVGGDA